MKNALILVFVLFIQSAAAEKLVFTNNNEEVEITENVEIDFVTGDVSVTTVGEHFIVSGNQNTPVILGFYPSDYDITTGSSITVSWSVAYAASCTADTTSGVATWNGAKTAADGSYSQSVTVTTLPATLELSCQNAAAQTTTKSFLLTEQSGGGGGSPSITLFTVNSQSTNAIVGPSTSATVAWNSTNTTGCTASASPAVVGWSGAKGTSGSSPVTINQNTTLTLNCNGAISTVGVTYTLDESCSSVVLPPNLDMVQGTYTEFNQGQPFGENNNVNFELDIQNSKFYALSGFSLEADNPPFNNRRKITLQDAPTQRQISQSTMSISECPGDFTQSAVCVIPLSAANSTARFSTVVTDDPGTFCILEAGKSYYVNYVNSPNPLATPPSCEISSNFACTIFYNEGVQSGL